MTTIAGSLHSCYVIPLKLRLGRRKTLSSIETDAPFSVFCQKVQACFAEFQPDKHFVKYRDMSGEELFVNCEEAFRVGLADWYNQTMSTGERVEVEVCCTGDDSGLCTSGAPLSRKRQKKSSRSPGEAAVGGSSQVIAPMLAAGPGDASLVPAVVTPASSATVGVSSQAEGSSAVCNGSAGGGAVAAGAAASLDDGKRQRFLDKVRRFLCDEGHDPALLLPEVLAPALVRCAICGALVRLSEPYKTQNLRVHLSRELGRAAPPSAHPLASLPPVPLSASAGAASTAATAASPPTGAVLPPPPPPAPGVAAACPPTAALPCTPAFVPVAAGPAPAASLLPALPADLRVSVPVAAALAASLSGGPPPGDGTAAAMALLPDGRVSLPPELAQHERLLRPLLNALGGGRLQPRHLVYQLLQAMADAADGVVRPREAYPALLAWLLELEMHTSGADLLGEPLEGIPWDFGSMRLPLARRL